MSKYPCKQSSAHARWVAMLMRALPDEIIGQPMADGVCSLEELASRMEAAFRDDDDEALRYGQNAITKELKAFETARYTMHDIFTFSCLERYMMPPDVTEGEFRALRGKSAHNDYINGNCNLPSHGWPLLLVERMPWEVRESIRLDWGKYMRVPWQDLIEPIKGHYLHVSEQDMTQVAYTNIEDPRKRKVRLRPGRYLSQFYPDMDEKRKQSFATMMGGEYKLNFAVKADDIEKVYTSGPSSCMSPKATEFRSSEHPVRVYGDSDLQLAYMTEGSSEKPLARTLVWPEKMKVGRLYGDVHRLRHLLEAAGYDLKDTSGCALIGARFRYIKDEEEDALVMPYIDGEQRYSIIDETWCRIGGVNLASFTHGLDREVGGDRDHEVRCDRCNDYFSDDDVFRVETSDSDTENWCYHCRDEHATRSQLTNRWIDDDCITDVQVRRSSREGVEIWAQWEAEDRARHCEGLSMFAFGYEMRDLEDGRTVSDFWFRDNGVTIGDKLYEKGQEPEGSEVPEVEVKPAEVLPATINYDHVADAMNHLAGTINTGGWRVAERITGITTFTIDDTPENAAMLTERGA